jgi:hypothetical protein
VLLTPPLATSRRMDFTGYYNRSPPPPPPRGPILHMCKLQTWAECRLGAVGAIRWIKGRELENQRQFSR